MLYRFAVAAVSAGAFSLAQANETFAAIIVGELCWGVGVGWTMLRMRRFMGDPRLEMVLSLITPFLAYWPPEHLGGSGVIATVATGLYISWNGPRFISAATRIQGVFFWEFFTYLIEGLIFIFTGLQAQQLITSIRNGALAEYSLSAALVVAVVIIARFVWIFPMTYAPRWLSATLAMRDPAPPWQQPFVVAFTGVRGIVSLAAALAIPVTTANGAPFPYREQIFFLAFTVVMATLVLQGAMLPWVIRRLGLARAGMEERRAERVEEFQARRNAIDASMTKLEALAQERDIPGETVASLRGQIDYFATRIRMKCEADEDSRAQVELHDELDLLLIETEREFVNGLLRKGKLTDETRRRMERELDLREADVLDRRKLHAK